MKEETTIILYLCSLIAVIVVYCLSKGIDGVVTSSGIGPITFIVGRYSGKGKKEKSNPA